ncbi:MAG: PEP-CTERM sorting domain-containing protein [Pseudomonadota bacterium]|nr:PEP-CTERM sorting domain-containing protein [Pseudomonadota bacterium]
MKKFSYPLFAALVGFSSLTSAATEIVINNNTEITVAGQEHIQTYGPTGLSTSLDSISDVQLFITAKGDYNYYEESSSASEFLTFTIDDGLYTFNLNRDSADSATQVNIIDPDYFELQYTYSFSATEWDSIASDNTIKFNWINTDNVANIEDGGALLGSSGDFVEYSISGTVPAIPEPSTYALMITGLGLVGFMASRRKKV